MKLTKSRKDYKCDGCKAKISKGDLYAKKTKSIGSPNKETYDKERGAFVLHGITIPVRICESCAKQSKGEMR